MSRNAVFYIAKGQKYLNEAHTSALSLLSVIPEVDAHLLSFDAVSDYIFTTCHHLGYNEAANWYDNSIVAFNYALKLNYDNLVYLDTDTYILQPFSEVFELLRRFDIVTTHAPGRATTGSTIDFDFPADFHIGLVGFRICDKIRELFSQWIELYRLNRRVYGNNDQGALRDAIWHSDVSSYVLPPEYCFRFKYGGFLCGQVKVLHGRAKDYKALGAVVNSNTKMRTFSNKQLRAL